MEDLNSMITDLMTDLAAVKKGKLLDDNEVRQILGNLSQWELSLKEIKQLKSKIKKIKESLPDTREKEAKGKRNKKLKNKMEDLNSMITDLMTDLTAVKKAKLLSDNEVRQTLSNLS